MNGNQDARQPGYTTKDLTCLPHEEWTYEAPKTTQTGIVSARLWSMYPSQSAVVTLFML